MAKLKNGIMDNILKEKRRFKEKISGGQQRNNDCRKK